MILWTDEASRTSCPDKVLPFRRLPTEDRPRIVLQGDQGIDLANARIDQVVHAPILHYAIGMFRWLCRWLCRCLLPREICNQRLAARATAKKAKYAKKTQRHRRCGKGFSHDGSPIDSVQYSAKAHITFRILFAPRLSAASLLKFPNYSNHMCNTCNSKLAYPVDRKSGSSWSPGKTKTADRRWQTKLYSPRTEFRQTKSSHAQTTRPMT